MRDIEMLQHLHKSAELGRVRVEAALQKNNDPVMRKGLHSKLRIYQEIYGSSANSLMARGVAPQSANPLIRLHAFYSSSRAPRAGREYKGDDPMIRSLVAEMKRADELS